MNLDKAVKNENGVPTDEMEKLMTERGMTFDSLKEILSELLEQEELLADEKNQMKSIQEGKPDHVNKTNGKHLDDSSDARHPRRKVKEHMKSIAAIQKQI